MYVTSCHVLPYINVDNFFFF